MTRRVAVTGLGTVCPVGNTMPEAWQSLLEGRSGVGRITLFDPSPFAIQIAGEVKNFSLNGRVDPKQARHMDRHVQFAVTAAQEALADAGLEITPANADRVGVIIGSAAGGVPTVLNAQKTLETRGPDRVNPFFLPNFLVDAATGHIAILTGAAGPNMAVASACATGSHALGEAMHTIKRGEADAIIAGGADTVVIPLTLAGFINMKGLGNHEEPERASRPFDKDRTGFVISEAAAILILEELEHARARGAHIYAEMVGYGATNDAFHMFAQAEDGEGAARAMSRALASAGLRPEEIDYINAHGTGTPLNDRVETLAIKRVFGEHAYRLAVSSTKSMTGHMMGASGALEGAICALALQHGIIPPTINLETPDPECDLDYVPNIAREQRIRTALSNSIGLGGHNGTIILAAV